VNELIEEGLARHTQTHELEQWLRRVCNTEIGPYLRPFAPNAAWRNADVFVVGTNPATPLRDEFDTFDSYWNALTRDTAEFQLVYASKHSAGASKTSQRASRLAAHLSPLNVLRTNAFAYPAPRARGIPDKPLQQVLGQQIFEALVRICRPKVIFFHGNPALHLAARTFAVSLDRYVPLSAQNTVVRTLDRDGEIRLFGYPHFSGMGVKGFEVGRMDEDLASLAQTLAGGLEPGQPPELPNNRR
jgi:hypothetical protein